MVSVGAHGVHQALILHSACPAVCHMPPAAAVEERIAAWTMLPAENGEGLQVLRYENTQKYDAHWVSVTERQLCGLQWVFASAW